MIYAIGCNILKASRLSEGGELARAGKLTIPEKQNSKL